MSNGLRAFFFARAISLIAEKIAIAHLCVIFGYISQFWRHHHDEPLLNFSHLMHNIGDLPMPLILSITVFRELQSPGFNLNPLTTFGLFALVLIYAGMHFDLQWSLSKSSITTRDAKYEFFVHF